MRATFRNAVKFAALLPVGAFLFAVLVSGRVLAADPGVDAQKAALLLILNTAKQICSEPVSDGRYQSVSIKATSLPAASPALGSGEFTTEKYEGSTSKNVFEVNEGIIGCKLKVISVLVDKLLPSTPASESPASKSFEVTDDPGTIASEIIDNVCRLQIGMSERKFSGECKNGSCKIQHETDISYTPFIFYLKPGFQSVFYSPFKSDEHKDFEIKTNWSSSVLSVKTPIPVERKFKFSPLPAKYAARLSSCVQEIGDLLLQRLKSSEFDQSSTLPPVKAADYNVVQYTLRDLDFASLQLSYPKHLRSGSNSTIEVTIVPPAVWKTQSINLDEERSDEKEQKQFSAMEDELSKSPQVGEALKVIQSDKLSIEFSSGDYQLLPLVKQDYNISAASLKLALDSVAATPLTPEEQTLRPLQSRSWSWQLKPNDSGDQTLFVSGQAKRITGEPVSFVLRVQLVVEESYINRVINFLSANWQWIAGSIIIPLIAFAWSRVMRSREPSDESSRGTRDRTNLQRRRTKRP